jgi:hypothetical protein
MEMGNIRDLTPQEAMASARRAEIVANAATSRVCRRCLGKTFVLDTTPLAATCQPIDKFGDGYGVVEPDLGGRPARWTKGTAHAYFYTRLRSLCLSLDIYSPHPASTRFGVLLSRWDDTANSFVTDTYHEFTLLTGCYSRLTLAVQLKVGQFYRLTLVSPIMELSSRWLGLGVADMHIKGRPVEHIDPDHAHPRLCTIASSGMSTQVT